MANAGADADAAHLQMLLDHAERAEDHHATFEEASVGALDDSHVGINVAVASDVPIVTSGTDGPTTGVIGSPQVIVAADADATDRTFDETRLQLDKCVPELLPWLMACRTANDGAEDTPASADDAFFFLETNHPELVHTNAHDRLFEWMTSFMLLQHPTVGSGSTALEEPAAIERFPASVQAAAVEQLAEANDSTSVANEFGLKSTLTLHYWAHMQQQQHEFIDASVLETPLSDGLEQKQELSGARANGRFYHQTALLDWISSHQGTTLTRQDVLRHIVTTYPEFAASKSVDTLKTWIGRLLKRHLPATTASGSSSSVELGADEEDHQSDQIPGAIEADSKTDDIRSNQTESPSLSTVPSVSPLPICGGPIAPSPCSEATDTNGKRRQKRGASDRYVTHSNEFKLNALQKLDEGFSISEVAEELGLKSQNTLAYWSSIRDKLVMSEKKRFRLAGGGRRSSCSFEEELLTWVTERYQRGEGTDVKSVLEYLQEFHPSFTDGKKEPTLRKWILRFFKRCWRAPSTSNDVEKSCMFVTVSSRVAPRSLRAQLDAINQDQETLESSNSVQACASFSADIDARQALLRNRLIPRMRLSRTSIPRLLPSYVCATAKSSASQEKRRQSFDQGVSENHTAKHDIRVADVVSFGDRARLYEQRFGKTEPLFRYVLHVIDQRLRVYRADIPKRQFADLSDKASATDHDVLFLTYDPQPPCGFRNIYWLIFVDEDTVLNSQTKLREYFTLSPFGLTHFVGASVTEVAELSSWIDEKRAFDYMTNMKGLARIQQLLFFCSWKQHAVYHKHRRIRAQLACSLFACHRVASRLLLCVHSHCLEIAKAAIDTEVDQKRTYSIHQFKQLQLSRLKQAQHTLVTHINAVRERISSETRESSPAKSELTRRHGISSSAISSSLERANLQERMFTFLRLVDLHITEAIIRHLSIYLFDFFSRVCGRSDTHSSLQKLDCDLLMHTHISESDYTTWYNEDSTKNDEKGEQIHEVSFEPYFLPSSRLPPLPFIHLNFQVDEIKLETEALPQATYSENDFVDLRPTKSDIFELIHGILHLYMTGIDEAAHLILDSRFGKFLAPFAPHQRQRIVDTMIMPSTVIFENFGGELSHMRQTLETYFMQIHLVQAKHLKCFHNIQAAEYALLAETNRVHAAIFGDISSEAGGQLQSVVNAERYELSQKSWGKFLRYSTKTPQRLQIGCFLVDQGDLLQQIQRRVVGRIVEMDQALPNVYKKFLSDMLVDVDNRIQKVTNIPITITDAAVWISQVTEMMPIHTSRQLFDDKCKNLQRLKTLLLARGISFAQSKDFEMVRQMEFEWESTHETLLLCLDRVQERDSEHRRSFQDLTLNTKEHINNQLDLICAEFDSLPTGIEHGHVKIQERNIAANLLSTQQDQLVKRLEKIVHLESEFKNLLVQFSVYDRAYRYMMDVRLEQPCISAFQDSNETAGQDSRPLPSESLMDYIVTSIDVRKWFTSWITQNEKWSNAMLESVHPALVLNRIMQFRRRLAYASSRMFRRAALSTIYPSEHQISFVDKDRQLVLSFEKSIQQMMYDYRVFEAIAGGSFTDERWQIVAQLCPEDCTIEWNSYPFAKTTLSFLKKKWSVSRPENMNIFMDLCDQSILESKLRLKMENIQRIIRGIRVQLREQNYVVRCDEMPSAIAILEDMHLDVRLLLQRQNPWLETILQLLDEIERKEMMCNHILDFQQQWQLICEMTKVHDIDEFFCGRSSSAASATKENEAVWNLFLKTTQAWSDNMRRLYCMNSTELVSFQQQNRALVTQRQLEFVHKNTSLETKEVPTKKPSSFSCNVDDLLQVFDDFDFDTHETQCERALQLMRQFLTSLRSKSPRLWCLDDIDCLRLLCHESDSDHLKKSLRICYPHIQQFTFGNYVQQSSYLNTERELGSNDTDESNQPQHSGLITFTGISNRILSVEFKAPVIKIGRINFWLTRLEEELSELVQENSLQAIHYVMDQVINAKPEAEASALSQRESVTAIQLLPQSMGFAMIFLFSNQVTEVLDAPLLYPAHTTSVDKLQSIAQLQTQLTRSIANLLRILKEPEESGFSSFDSRVENMILVGLAQQHKLDHMTKLLQNHQHDQAQYFWLMQFKIYLGDEAKLTGNIGEKNREQEKTDLLQASVSSCNNAASAVTWTAQIGYHELPLGRECIGFTRLPVITPFTERCLFTIYSAIRIQAMALILPIDSALPTKQQRQGGYSIFTELSQLLFKPSFELRCTSNTNNMNRLEYLMEAIYRLNGFLVICDFPVLSRRMQGVFHEKMVDEFHKTLNKTNVTSRSSSVLVNRKNAFVNAAIFIPMSDSMLETSELIRSVQTPFRPVVVTPLCLLFYIEAILLIEGFSSEYSLSINLLPCFESISNSVIAEGHCIQSGIRKVIKCASYLVASSSVTWRKALSPTDSKFNRRRSIQNVNTSEIGLQSDDREVIAQIALRQAIEQAYNSLLAEKSTVSFRRNFKLLLDKQLPLAVSGNLAGDSKHRNAEDTMENAIRICMEHSGLAVNTEEIQACMKIWKSLSLYRGFLVYGEPGCGKTTCIKTLHNAVRALEVTHLQDRSSLDSQVAPSQLSSILVVNAQLLSMDELYGPVHGLITQALCRSEISQRSQYHQWIMFDGVLHGKQLEPVLGILEPSVMHLAASNGARLRFSDAVVSEGAVRIIFETLDLAEVSPSAMVSTGMIYVASKTISYRDLIDAWREHWMRAMPFVAGSAGANNLSLIFRLVELLVSDVCVQFIKNEHEIQNAGSENEPSSSENEVETTETMLRLGFLTLNAMTDTALALIASLCLRHRSVLEDATRTQVTLIVFFCVIWGVSGHVNDSMRHKLDHFLRQKVKDTSDLKNLCDLQGTLFDSERFIDYWDDNVLQQYMIAPSDMKGVTNNDGTREHALYDSASGEFVIVSQQALSQLRICSRSLRCARAVLLVGPPGSGKSSLLRLLYLMNEQNQSVRMMDATVESNQPLEALDWMHTSRAWFRPDSGEFCSTGIVKSSRLKGEDQLLAAFKAGSIIFLDDLSLDAAPGSSSQEDFVRFVLDHQLVFSRRHAKMVPLPKQFAAAMRLPFDVSLHTRLQPHVERLMRHFTVLQVPTYNRKQLMGIFREKNRTFFQQSHENYERGTAGSDLLLSLEESVLRANIDLLVELSTLQQRICDRDDDALVVFNLHHLSMLLTRTFGFASRLKSIQHRKLAVVTTDTNSSQAPASRSMGTTLVSLGKLHQCWISEVRSIFLRNSASDIGASHSSLLPSEQRETARKKLWMALRLISEKYFSVSLRNDDHIVKAEMVYFTLQFVSQSLKAVKTLYDTRLRLEEFMTQFASVSSTSGSTGTMPRRGVTVIDGTRGEYSISFLKQILLQHVSISPEISVKPLDDLSCLDMNLMLTSPFWLNQLLHIVHALGNQMHLVISTPTGTNAMVSRLLYFASAIHGFQVNIMYNQHSEDTLETFLQTIVRDVVIEAKPVALWIDYKQFCKLADSEASTIDGATVTTAQNELRYLMEFIMEMALRRMPSIILRNAQLRDAVITSCIERRQSLQVVAEMDWMLQTRDLIQRNLRICLFDSIQQSRNSLEQDAHKLVTWLKTTNSFQWCILGPVADIEQTKLDMAEATEALILSTHLEKEHQTPVKAVKLSNFSWSCLQIHSLALSFPFAPEDPCIQLSHLLSFLENTIVRYHVRERLLHVNMKRRELALEEFKVMEDQLPRLVTARERLESQLHQLTVIHEDALDKLNNWIEHQRVQEDGKYIEENSGLSEAHWIMKAICEEIELHIAEVHTHVADVTRQIAQLEILVAIGGEEAGRWRNALTDLQALQRFDNIASVALFEASMMAYSFVTACNPHKRNEFIGGVKELLGENENENTDSDDELSTQKLNQTEKDVHDFTEVEEKTARLVWQTLFPFILDESIYRNLLTADHLCDHIPVFVDSTGLLQQFLIHVFEELPFFDGKFGPNTRKDTGHVVPNSMVIRCEDTEFEAKMQDARRRCIPVLLVNFQERLAMNKLRPFLQPPRPQRQPMLHKLTLQTHATYVAQRSKRLANKRKSDARKQSLLTVSPSELVNAVNAITTGRRNSLTGNSDVKPAKLGLLQTKQPLVSPTGFQIYAVTQLLTPFSDRSTASHFSVFSIDWSLKTLESHFHHVCIRTCDLKLFQAMQDARQLHAESCLNMIRLEANMWLSLPRMASSDETQRSACRLSDPASVFANSFIELNQEERKHRSEVFMHNERCDALAVEAQTYEHLARELTGIAISMNVTSSLMGYGDHSLLYAKNFTWLQHALEQLQAKSRFGSVRVLELFEQTKHDEFLTQILQDISYGIASASHRLIFAFLVLMYKELRHSCSEGVLEEYYQVIGKLGKSTKTAWATAFTSSASSSDDMKIKEPPAAINPPQALVSSEQPASSIVDRFRRKVRLCSRLLEKPSAKQHVDNKHASRFLPFGSFVRQIPTSPPQERRIEIEIQHKLKRLAGIADSLFYHWKVGQEKSRAELRSLLASLGLVTRAAMTRRRSVRAMDISMTNSAPGAVILLQSREQLLVEFGIFLSDVQPLSFEKELGRLLVAKAYFPDWFADLLKQYVESHDPSILMRSSTNDVFEPKMKLQSWQKNDQGVCFSTGERFHRPQGLLLYNDPIDRHSMEILLLDKWNGSKLITVIVWNASQLAATVTSCISSKERFMIELLNAEHFDPALSLVSRLVDRQALLVVPQWYLLCSLQVAQDIMSSRLSLLQQSIITTDESMLVRVTDWFARHGILSKHLATEVARRLLETANAAGAVNSQVVFPIAKQMQDIVVQEKLSEDTAIMAESTASVEIQAQQMQRLAYMVHGEAIQKEVIDEHTATPQVHSVSSLGMSLELMNDFTFLSQSFGTSRSQFTSASYTRTLFHPLQEAYDSMERTLAADSDDAADLFPWWQVKHEYAEQVRVFKVIHDRVAYINSIDKKSPPELQQALMSVSRGLVPPQWMSIAFNDSIGEAVNSVVALSQLIMLFACRLTFLGLAMFHRDRVSSLQLAVLSDVRSFLLAMKHHCASMWGVAVDLVDLQLKFMNDADQGEDSKVNTGEYASQTLVILNDLDGQACGIFVEGLFLIERIAASVRRPRAQVQLHPLPVCQLRCVCKPVESTISQLPLLIMPSLSPYQHVPTCTQLTLVDQVRLNLASLAASVPTVNSSDQDPVDYALGFPVFVDEYDQQNT